MAKFYAKCYKLPIFVGSFSILIKNAPTHIGDIQWMYNMVFNPNALTLNGGRGDKDTSSRATELYKIYEELNIPYKMGTNVLLKHLDNMYVKYNQYG